MIADYWCVHAALAPGAAASFYRRIAFHYPADESEVSAVEAQTAPPGRRRRQTPVSLHLGGAVQLPPETYLELEAASRRCEITASVDAPSLWAIDRLVALPRAMSVLDGCPVAWLPPERRERFASTWNQLLTVVGGARALAALVGPYLDSWGAGESMVLEEIEAVARALEHARREDLDLLLICAPAPTA